MDNVSRPLWRLLLLTKEPEKSVKLTCEECFVLLEYYADLLAAGVALNDIRPSVMHHLSLCSTCQTKFDGWLKRIDGEAEASAQSESHQ